jgi:hypothetical protein
MAYAAILPIGLAYALLRDEYDEEVLGRKQNVMNPLTDDPLTSLIDVFARVGTFGIAGEFVNTVTNMDTQREFSVDNRVFFVSTLLNTKRAVETWVHQDYTADYQTVYRPLMQALGGSGYLQYADSILTLLDADTQENRVLKRVNAMNYLRTTGRSMNLDVRAGRSIGSALPTPTKPFIGQMVLAAYANSPGDFNEAYRKAIDSARNEGKPDPEDYVRRSFQAYHPLRLVFRTVPSEREFQQMLGNMGEDGSTAVSNAVRLYNAYGARIGVKPSTGKETKLTEFKRPTMPSLSLDQIRAMAASY